VRAGAGGDAGAVVHMQMRAVAQVRTRVVMRVPEGRPTSSTKLESAARRGAAPWDGRMPPEVRSASFEVGGIKGDQNHPNQRRGKKGQTWCAAWALSCRATCATLCSHQTCAAMEDLALKLEATEGGASTFGLHARSKRSVPMASSKAAAGASSKTARGSSCVVKLRNHCNPERKTFC
jgi:hypothetical protein